MTNMHNNNPSAANIYSDYGESSYIRRFFGTLIDESMVAEALRKAGYDVEKRTHKEGQIGSHGRWEIRSTRTLQGLPTNFEVHQGYKDNRGSTPLVDTIVQGLPGWEKSVLDHVAQTLENAYVEHIRETADSPLAAEAELQRACRVCAERKETHLKSKKAGAADSATTAMIDRAKKLDDENKLVDAKAEYHLVLQQQQKTLRPDNKEYLRVAATLVSLAGIERRMGNLQQAYDLYREVLDVQKRFLNLDDKRLKSTKRNLDRTRKELRR